MKDKNKDLSDVSDLNVYIYRDGGLGDSLTILPAVKKLYESMGGKKKFTLITNDSAHKFNKINSYEILKYSGFFENVLYFDDGKLSSKVNLLKDIKKSKTGKILYYFGYTDIPLGRALKKTLLHLSFFKLCGFKKVIGWRQSITDNKKNKENGGVESEYSRYLRIVGAADIAAATGTAAAEGKNGNTNQNNEIFLNLDYAKPGADKLIMDFDINADGRYVSIGIGGLYEVNRYFNKRYGEVIKMIAGKFKDIGFVLIGGANDFEDGEKIKRGLPEELNKKVANICGKSSIIESAYIMGNGLLYIGNDNGTTHLAAMSGCPVAAVFSAREKKEKYFPYGKNNIVIRKNIECENCGLKICAEKNTKCVDAITAEEVFAAALKLIRV